ncbi:cytochrome b/b6 domain-containing protein [Pelomonas sp. SE-A7]|uniref:cytochrome b/b6 domain-containing protein n=1 Tax=Pelomonas sp. SE-A7 TaxID=3054953 RepID=UPI00259D1D14|nr:cytochrome b/b6 domain-containing protein [Pelomonas sp. SE-A7]MDM4768121.1 cytochrome b/b6 domain-containing protein [Pelomonas sp. SE-A7]
MADGRHQDHEEVRVWDLPTRLFHWALVLCVLGSVTSAKIGGNAMVWHMRLGYAVLALVGFRLLWGLVGGRWSRFTHFIYSPAAIWRYLRRKPREGEHFDVGHNPLGGLSVLAMLVWLLMQIGSGLIADDEIANTGPLIRLVSSEASLAWTGYHKSWGQWGLFLLIGLHVVAIIYYRFGHGRDLIGPMLSGNKRLPAHVPATRDTVATRLFALTLLAACVAAVYLLVVMGGGE